MARSPRQVHLCAPASRAQPLTGVQNAQIDVALNSALQSRPLAKPSDKLSPEGKTLVADLRDVVEKAKLLVLTKNEGNLLQDFIWQTQQLERGNFQSPSNPVAKDKAQQQGREAVDGLRTLGTLIISNGQFRKLRMLHHAPAHLCQC